MSKEKSQKCWNHFQCKQEDKERCPAYIEKEGSKCWTVASANTDVINSGVGIHNGLKICWECSFFQKQSYDK
jgi:hypothetical protein